MTGLRLSNAEPTLGQKVLNLNWFLVLVVCVTAALGMLVLYSLADGATDTWVRRQAIRFGIGFTLMLVVALTDIRFWLRFSYVGYLLAFLALAAVEIRGIGDGATRWVELGFVTVQPSEVMKIALVMALARYYHEHTLEEARGFRHLAVPVLLIAAPATLVLRQPDLGTAALLALGGGSVMLLAGVRARIFGALALVAMAVIPIVWQFLRGYQRERILTFLDPERDPLGAGYHILQSKVALGAGGVFGRGFRQGTQSHLNFLPEMQTDFIFATLAEELGLAGGLLLIGLYVVFLIYGLAIGLRARNHFGRLLAMGVSMTFFFYVFVNIAMVTGLLPVVGVPLPLISYGGTAMVTLLIGFGLMMSVYIHRDVRIPRRPGGALS